MPKIDTLVQDFFAQEKIAVVGVSDKRETGCNLGYRKFKEAGYTVSAVNPHLTTFEGDPCYPDLKSIPEKPDAVLFSPIPRSPSKLSSNVLPYGHQARTGGEHDQRLAGCCSNVPRQRHHRDPRRLSKSILKARFRPHHDAGHLSHAGFSQRQLALHVQRSNVKTCNTMKEILRWEEFWLPTPPWPVRRLR
jgi:hypothetical protein